MGVDLTPHSSFFHIIVPQLQSLVLNEGDKHDLDIIVNSNIDSFFRDAHSVKYLLNIFPVIEYNKKEVLCKCGSLFKFSENEEICGTQTKKF